MLEKQLGYPFKKGHIKVTIVGFRFENNWSSRF